MLAAMFGNAPAPRPSSKRPPLSTSSEAAALAMTAGGRSGRLATSVNSAIRVVSASSVGTATTYRGSGAGRGDLGCRRGRAVLRLRPARARGGDRGPRSLARPRSRTRGQLSPSPRAIRSRSSRQRVQQRLRVVGARVHRAIDEQGRGALHLAGRDAALHIPANACEHAGAGPVALKLRDIEAELGSIRSELVFLERVLAMKEQLVHVPELLLVGGCFRRGRRRQGVRVDLCQGKVPEGEADAPRQLFLDAFDLAKRLARVRTLIVAVLDDQRSGRRPAQVIDGLVKWLHHLPALMVTAA